MAHCICVRRFGSISSSTAIPSATRTAASLLPAGAPGSWPRAGRPATAATSRSSPATRPVAPARTATSPAGRARSRQRSASEPGGDAPRVGGCAWRRGRRGHGDGRPRGRRGGEDAGAGREPAGGAAASGRGRAGRAAGARGTRRRRGRVPQERPGVFPRRPVLLGGVQAANVPSGAGSGDLHDRVRQLRRDGPRLQGGAAVLLLRDRPRRQVLRRELRPGLLQPRPGRGLRVRDRAGLGLHPADRHLRLRGGRPRVHSEMRAAVLSRAGDGSDGVRRGESPGAPSAMGGRGGKGAKKATRARDRAVTSRRAGLRVLAGMVGAGLGLGSGATGARRCRRAGDPCTRRDQRCSGRCSRTGLGSRICRANTCGKPWDTCEVDVQCCRSYCGQGQCQG